MENALRLYWVLGRASAYLLVACLPIFICAVSLAADATAESEAPIQHSPLYKIEWNGKLSWIIGTIHSSQISLQAFPEVRKAIQDAKSIWVENYTPIDWNDPQYEAAPDENVVDHLPRPKLMSAYYLMTRAFESSMSREKASTAVQAWMGILKPGVIHYLLQDYKADELSDIVRREEPATDPSEKRPTFDEQIRLFGESLGKKASQFTAADQWAWYAQRFGLRDLEKWIDKTLTPRGEIKPELVSEARSNAERKNRIVSDAIRLYNARAPSADILKLLNAMELNDFVDSAKLAEYLDGMHEHWMTDILKQLEIGGAFIAVGMAHVDLDERSIVPRLRSMGATVTPMKIRLKTPAPICRKILD